MPRISWLTRCCCILPMAVLLPAVLTHAQVSSTAAGSQPATVEDALHQMSDQAGVIFAGMVTAIRRHQNGDLGSGLIEVEFHVDQAVRGCTTGTTYILREWAGLCAGDDQRYRVGQRLLMILTAPGAAGMSSPVGGMDGAIPIQGGGASTLVPDAVPSPQYPMVNLRWLGARLLHPVSYRAEPPTPFLVSQLAVSALTAPSNTLGGNVASEASIPSEQASVDVVLNMLTSWEKAQHATR